MNPEKLHQVQKLSSAGLKTFFNIAAAWKLNNDDQMILLGLNASSTFYKWKSEPTHARLTQDTLERISYILGIFKALQILIPNIDAADQWLITPNDNPLFAGQAPLVRLRNGRVADLYAVRQFLDAQRGWG